MTNDWGVLALPTNFLIDPKGKVVAKFGDLSGSAGATLEGKIERLLR